MASLVYQRRLLPLLLLLVLTACATGNSANTRQAQTAPNSPAKLEKAPVNKVPVIHLFVALCDNVNQGIVPVSAILGNGDNPKTNLYWGAAFGVKTFFSKHKDWELISTTAKPDSVVLERSLFKHRHHDLFLIADAYQGKEIAQATKDFLDAAGGKPGETLKANGVELHTHGSAEMVVYVGHNGLMDFKLAATPQQRDDRHRKAIILACASKPYFASALRQTGASPLLWTTNLMAPEAYTLAAAIDGWLNQESDEQIRLRAAQAYDKYQKCGLKSARTLFATGW